MVKNFILLVSIVATTAINSQTIYTSPASGSASGGLSTWNNISWSVSGSGSPTIYVIQNGFTFTINSSINFPGSDLQISGGLVLNVGNNDLTMPNNGMISIANGGSITGGNPSNQISIGSNVMSGSSGSGFNLVGPLFATSSTTGFVTITPLPVKWQVINAKVSDKKVLINAIGAEILNVSSFEIERSENNIDFQSIANINITDMSSNASIEHVDVDAPNAVLYYRIKTNDNDGTETYSELIIVDNRSNEVVNIFPTLLNASVTNLLTVETDSQESLMLQDMSGKSISVYNVNGSNQYQLPSLNSGLYFLYSTGSSPKLLGKIMIK